IAKVSADGFVSIFNYSGTTQVVVDVLGWFPAGSSYTGLKPARLLETRTGPGLGTVDGQSMGTGAVGAGSVTSLAVLGRGGVPASGVGAVALNVTATEPTAPSFLTVYPKGGTRPNASNVNLVVGQTVANMVIAKVGADGQISIFNFGGNVQVVVDVLGWFPSADVARIDIGSGAVAGVGGDSSAPAISADGRFVAFESTASNLVDADTNGLRDIFVHDLQTNTTTRVDVSSAGQESAGGDSIAPSISAEGRYVVFHSSATNLVPDDTNGKFDVFVHDMVTGSTTRVSLGVGGAQGDNNSTFGRISGNGRYVAFMSSADDLVPDDTNTAFDVFVRDLAGGTTTRVSVATGGAQATGDTGSALPAISFDGRFVAFESTTTNLVPGDTNARSDVFVRDTIALSTTRVSVGPGGIQENGGATNAAVSDDGRFVGFESDASNLVAADTNGLVDVFLRDTLTASTIRASVSNAGNQAAGSSFSAAISDDGRLVAFHSLAPNLVANDGNGIVADVFVRDVVAGTTKAISVASDGSTATGGNSLFPSLTADGRYVAYQSDATNIVADDVNGVTDIYISDLGAH
ncbi:MAG: WD40-like Beta Propeller Repeat, partial [Ilumatobacteraceae bacterium]|nr:WD40-like Beta Propeller Repeat [Ilumatobacteraceae bacterium]